MGSLVFRGVADGLSMVFAVSGMRSCDVSFSSFVPSLVEIGNDFLDGRSGLASSFFVAGIGSIAPSVLSFCVVGTLFVSKFCSFFWASLLFRLR